MLASDPCYQWIAAWLAPRPRPRPRRDRWESDPDYRRRASEYRTHGPNPLHDVGRADPEECLQVMQQSLLSMVWVSSQGVPEYHEWFIEQDERPSYRRYADNLRLIGGDDLDRPWLLKNPSHTFGMAAMLTEFPDAVFVHIHRDPAQSIVSGCSLIVSMGLGDGTFTASELGAHQLRIWALAAERMDAARAGAPDRTFVDVDYRAFVADPLAVIRSIYSLLSRTLSSEAEAAMQKWLVAHPMGRHGTHRYLVGRPETRRRKLDGQRTWSQYVTQERVSGVEFAGGPPAGDFGLTERAIRHRMAGYIDHYGIGGNAPREAQRA